MVQLDDALAERQADAVAGMPVAPVQTMEQAEDLAARGFGDADAVVAHPQDPATRIDRFRRDAHPQR